VDGLVLGRGGAVSDGADKTWGRDFLACERVSKYRNRACKANTQIRVVKFRLYLRYLAA
jgi:hypothetical protein